MRSITRTVTHIMRRKAVPTLLAGGLAVTGVTVVEVATASPALAASEFVFNNGTRYNIGVEDFAGVVRQVSPGRTSYGQYGITQIRAIRLASNLCIHATITQANGTKNVVDRGPGSRISVSDGQTWNAVTRVCA